MPAGCQPGGASVRASGGRGRRGGTQDDGFWSAFATTSEAERLQTLTMQQNNRIQLLLKIMQESKKADGAVERGCGLADGMGGEDERPPPGRLAAPGTMSCRATFLVFLIHQGVDAGLLWHFLGGTRGCEPPPSSRSECSRRLLCPAGSRGPRAHAGRGCGVYLRHGGAANVPRGNVSGSKVKNEGTDVPGSDSRCLRVLHVGPR